MGEDLPVELGELGSGLDPELLDEHLARPSIGLQRIGLAPAAVQREHQLRVQLLAPRMLGGQAARSGTSSAWRPAARPASHAQPRRPPAAAPPASRARVAANGSEAEVAERRPPPERERLVEHGRRPLGCSSARLGARPRRAARTDRVELASSTRIQIAGGRREQHRSRRRALVAAATRAPGRSGPCPRASSPHSARASRRRSPARRRAGKGSPAPRAASRLRATSRARRRALRADRGPRTP